MSFWREVRDCQDYDETQKWFWSPTDGRLRHATFTASINHAVDGAGYALTKKVPTWRHHCLAHVLSVDNSGTPSGHVEVWGGPLACIFEYDVVGNEVKVSPNDLEFVGNGGEEYYDFYPKGPGPKIVVSSDRSDKPVNSGRFKLC